MEKNDYAAELALQELARRTRLIREATSTRARAGLLVWIVLALGFLIFVNHRFDDPSIHITLAASFVFCALQPQLLLLNRRLDALTRLLEVEKLWQTEPES